MNRILTILVLLVTVSLIGAQVDVVRAEEPGAITVPQEDVKSGDLNGNLSDPDGDPDGMGTGNGLTDDDEPVLRVNGLLEGMSVEEIALYLLSLIEMLAI